MASEWVPILCSIGVFVLSAIWMWKRRGRGDQLPHYRGWPVVGNLFQVRRERPEFTFTKWSKDLGPVFSVKMLHKQFVVLSSFDAIYEALVKKGNCFATRPNKNCFRLEILTDNFSNIVRSQPTPTWRKLRKVCHKRIKMYDTGMKRIEEISTSMIKNLVEEFKTRNNSFNPKILLYNTVMNIVMTLLLGRTFSTDEELFQTMVQMEKRVGVSLSPSGKGSELDLFPWLRFFGNKTYKVVLELAELRDHLWDMMKMEADHGDQLLEEGEEDFRLVTALKEALAVGGSGITENNVKGVVVNDMTVAATTTTINTLCSFMNILIQHPGVQAKLQEEVDSVVGSERCVSLTDKEFMPYTAATIFEVLRYTSVVPLGIQHSCCEDTTIQGKVVPKGASVLMNLYQLHHDEDFWKNPFDFQPERFLDENGQLVSASHPNRRHLMPFSAGPRVCLGEVLAKNRLFLIISSLAQKFNIRQGDVTASCDPRSLIHGLILSSPDFEIIAEERK